MQGLKKFQLKRTTDSGYPRKWMDMSPLNSNNRPQE